jgi:hypothetical protein
VADLLGQRRMQHRFMRAVNPMDARLDRQLTAI